MKAHLINLDDTRWVVTTGTLEEAETAGDKLGVNYTIITDEQDAQSQLSRGELVTVYNKLTGAELKKFATKVDGARRLMAELDNKPVFTVEAVQENKSEENKMEQKKAGYKGHRSGSRKEQAHVKFDKDPEDRDGYMEFTLGLGVKKSTAQSWLTSFRKAAQ